MNDINASKQFEMAYGWHGGMDIKKTIDAFFAFQSPDTHLIATCLPLSLSHIHLITLNEEAERFTLEWTICSARKKRWRFLFDA